MTYSEYRNQFTDNEEFLWAYGSLTKEEAKAMIDAEICPPSIKACMMDTWRVARRSVKLRRIAVHYSESRELVIIFYDYDSDFNGNDFEYSYSLDAENTAEFLKQIPLLWHDLETNVKEWMIENVDLSDHGLGLQRKWIEMGLHGKSEDIEDYPGGIHHMFEF